MSKSMGPDEILKAKIAAMGEELGTLHFELWTEIYDLHSAWSEYKELYVEKSQNVELLNRTAPRYFYYAQRMFENGILLHLCRLTDPVSTGNKQNQTIQRIPALIEDETFRDAVQVHVDLAVSASEFARDHRNRCIAHKDLLLARKKHSKPLEAATVKKIKSAIKSLVNCMNEVQKRFEGGTTFYDLADGPGDARSLLHYLERGVKHRDQERNNRGF